jgi:TRAP-type mannitol/chloroaromatic compound transport system substrate-binding protein
MLKEILDMKKTLYILLSIALISSLVVGATGCLSSGKTYKWNMVTSWTADNLFYTKAAQAICDKVNKLSGGRLIIEPSPAGKMVGAMEVMDAVSHGKAEIGHSWSGYWLDKDPSFELFSSIPNQMVAQEWVIWLYGPTNGIELWKELYSPYHIIPFRAVWWVRSLGFLPKNPCAHWKTSRDSGLEYPGWRLM